MADFGPKKMQELDILVDLAERDKERACSEYRNKFGTTPVAFGTQGLWHNCMGMTYNFGCVYTVGMPVGICIGNERFWCDFLAAFGHLVEELYIISNYLSSSILTKCSGLKKLHLLENHNAAKEGFLFSFGGGYIRQQYPTIEFLEAEGMNLRLTLHECFPNLNNLTLRVFVSFSSQRLEESILKLATLQRLELSYCDYGSNELAKIIEGVPSLKHFHATIVMKEWSGADVCRFLSACERLSTMKLMVCASDRISAWRSNIAEGWKITNDGNKITIEKV